MMATNGYYVVAAFCYRVVCRSVCRWPVYHRLTEHVSWIRITFSDELDRLPIVIQTWNDVTYGDQYSLE